MHEVGLFTLSILNTDGPGMEKGWKPALGPGTFFRNDVQKSANFLCISVYTHLLSLNHAIWVWNARVPQIKLNDISASSSPIAIMFNFLYTSVEDFQ